MTLDGIVLLAAHTARSRAYIQALVEADLLPERVIILGNDESATAGTSSPRQYLSDLFIFDPAESVEQACDRAGIPVSHCLNKDLRSPEVLAAIRTSPARAIIFSGYGGQIVPADLLQASPPFLHLHSGWVPTFRGSTTLYYALLDQQLPAVSAIILDATIDTGPVIARRHYPRPPLSLDIDLVYDAAIRADLLVQVMRDYVQRGSFAEPIDHSREVAATYYVIHPVLKHLAVLSLSKPKHAELN